MRERTGKSARLTSVDFDRNAVNTVAEKPAAAAAEAPEEGRVARAEEPGDPLGHARDPREHDPGHQRRAPLRASGRGPR